MEDIGHRIGVHLALNVILNSRHEIVQVLAGRPQEVIRKGAGIVTRLNRLEVGHQYDVVIASPGGQPKDMNLYQSQKALAHAALITRPGGTIVMVAACPQGSGSEELEVWMEAVTDRSDVLPLRLGLAR